MPKPKAGKIIAGAFFADDQIIWDVVSCGNSTPPPFTQETTARRIELAGHKTPTAALPTFKECLAAVLTEIANTIPEGTSLDALCVAMPGPILGSGVRSSKERNRIPTHTTVRHRMGWSKEQIDQTLHETISGLKIEHVVPTDVPFVVHTDAAAYCVGDYHIEIAALAQEERPKVFAHIVVDEGVGGALVVNGKLLDTGHHSEIGHLPVRQHEDDLDFEPQCDAHNFRGCAESYVSLSALQRRWGKDVDLRLKHWTDGNEEAHLVAYYLAQICVSLILSVNATAIRFSGRAVRNEELIRLVSDYTKTLLQVPEFEYEAFYPGYSFRGQLIARRNAPDAGVYGSVVLAFEQMRTEG